MFISLYMVPRCLELPFHKLPEIKYCAHVQWYCAHVQW
jgi:hypothetical protein